jgi:hypothetical protein
MRVNSGRATNKLIHSAHRANNDEVFPPVLRLFLPEGAKVVVAYQQMGFVVEDLFVVVRKNRPGVSGIKTRQFHARKTTRTFSCSGNPDELQINRAR